MTTPQAFMLRAVLDRPGMLQRELSEELSIARPTTLRALDGLEQKGYIERRRSEGGAERYLFLRPPRQFA